MRQRQRNSELRLDRLQEDAAPDDEQRGILELFDQDEREPEPDEDAPLLRDGDQ